MPHREPEPPSLSPAGVKLLLWLLLWPAHRIKEYLITVTVSPDVVRQLDALLETLAARPAANGPSAFRFPDLCRVRRAHGVEP